MLFCALFGISDQSDVRRKRTAIAYTLYGEEQSLVWLDEAGGDYSKWEQLTGNQQRKRTYTAERKAQFREMMEAKKAENLRRIERSARAKEGTLGATVPGNKPEKELEILLDQLEKAEKQGDSASVFKVDSLKQRIAYLQADIRSPKI